MKTYLFTSMQQEITTQHFHYPNPDTEELFDAILQLQTREECEKFFRDLCTMQELKEMTERWQIAQMIWKGMPYRVINKLTGASSTTIARVAHWVKYGEGGYRKACRQLVIKTATRLYATNALPI